MDDPISPVIALLRTADPALADAVAARLTPVSPPPTAESLAWLAEQTVWALEQGAMFGGAVGRGGAELIAAGGFEARHIYLERVRTALQTGPTAGAIMAECLPPVVSHGSAELLQRYATAWEAMARKGSYTLREPLLALGPILASGDGESAALYLDLLQIVFDSDAAYPECRALAAALPKALLAFPPQRRRYQVETLLRLARRDRRLIEAFLDGMGRGLHLLGEEALDRFVAESLAAHRRHPDALQRALALDTQGARTRLGLLQVSVGWGQVRDRLARYLNARTGLGLSIRPISALPAVHASTLVPGRLVCSDHEAIYLPDEVDRFGRREENEHLYRLLVCLEASLHEFGTFEFDLANTPGPGSPGEAFDSEAPDIARFLGRFPDPVRAGDLFTVFELGRIRLRLFESYPGLVRRGYPFLQAMFRSERPGDAGPLDRLFEQVALGLDSGPGPAIPAAGVFAREISAASPVEAAAALTARFYDRYAAQEIPGPAPPFGWRPWPNPAAYGDVGLERAGARIRDLLAEHGIRAGRSDLRRRLKAGGGRLSEADVQAVCREAAGAARAIEEWTCRAPDCPLPDSDRDDRDVLRYPEWDDRLREYLPDHVRLRVHRPDPPVGDAFYADVLHRRGVLIGRTRQAFERLRPEGLERLRRWVDGDELDFRELVQSAVDRHSGHIPSGRVFIKRVKQQRDVAVLLLIDASRSTANTVPGSGASVLDVEKESGVLLCEALSALGDRFAVAAFSGSGRDAVDWFWIKEFGRPLGGAVKARFGALQPQRNTRLGAAVRHAGRELDAVPARVRLLVILSDGFPNDTGYKGGHAVADTRRALLELQARRIRFHALTVSLPADPQLDALYGRARHHVIADVRELPGRLLRVYSALTR
jgi:hypothetical protein